MSNIIIGCSNPVSSNDPTKEFWFRNPQLEAYAHERMEKARLNLHTVKDVKTLQAQFRTITEVQDFEPTIELVFARDLVGNCKSAAVLGQWSLEQIGIESRFVTLKGNGVPSHKIVISRDNTIMISNSEVLTGLDTELWQNQVYSWFGWKYNRMEE